MDLIDVLAGKADSVCRAKYFPRKTGENGTVFEYEYIDVRSKTYRMLFGTLGASQALGATIRTNAKIDFSVNAFIVLQDGKTYTISSVDIDVSSVSKQAYRLFSAPAGMYKVLRLTEVNDEEIL